MRSRFHSSKSEPPCRRGGFTLVEVIATLTLSSILIAMMLPLISSGLQGSRRGLLSLPKTQSLKTEMDAVWHLYRTTYPDDLPGLSQAIADAAQASPPPPYNLLENDWTAFDEAGVEYSPGSGIQEVLRVTLGNSEGERLTTYFFPIPNSEEP